MSSLGGKVIDLQDTFSIPRLNLKFITRMTGDEIAAQNIVAEPLCILCIEDGSGYKKGHFYLVTDDGVLYDSFPEHFHTDSNDGGSLFDIRRNNFKNIIEFENSLNTFAAAYWFTKSNTGTFVDNVDTISNTKYVVMTTSTTINDYCNIEAGGGRLFFGKPLTFQTKYAISHPTSVAYRMGIGNPLIQNTVTGAGAVAQMGFEGCTGTNQLNRVFSADGTTWTGEDMLNMVQAVPFGLRIDYYPSSKIVAMDGAGTVIIKTTNLPPISTATTGSSCYRAGIKALAGTAARNLKIYANRIVGYSFDSTSGIQGWV